MRFEQAEVCAFYSFRFTIHIHWIHSEKKNGWNLNLWGKIRGLSIIRFINLFIAYGHSIQSIAE